MKLVRKYINHFIKNFGIEDDESRGIAFWRDRLFAYLILVIAPIGMIVYIPSILMSIKVSSPIIAVVDTYAIVIVMVIIFSKRMSMNQRKLHFFIALYLMAATLLFYLGTNGPGLLYIFGLSLLALLLYDTKAGYTSLVVNFFLSFLPIIGFYTGDYIIEIEKIYTVTAILVFASNFWLINIVLVVGLAKMLEGLQNSITKEQELKHKLENESANLEKARYKAEESDRLKSAFLANMSHEIRTPMNSIIGFTSILNDKLSESEKLEYISIIKKNSNYLLSLINDIIDISKIESGSVNIKNEPVDLERYLQAIYENSENFYNKSLNYKININIDKSDINVFADKDKITQILNNFISNAFKFTEKGEIELGVFKNEKEEYCFYVNDTGIGIAKENMSKIFDRFHQIDEYIDGAGLGLAICKSLTELLGGRINVRSELHKGSTFELILNLNSSDIKVDKEMIKKATHINEEVKILVVEDQEDNYLLLKTALKHFGYQCDHVDNGIDAVERAKSEKYDIILMDLKLPLLNGIQATEEIRKFNSDVKIIAVTAYAFDSDKERVLNSGFDEYITKPIDLDELKRKIVLYVEG